MLSRLAMIRRMKRGWRGGFSGGTVCGQGSLLENTSVIRSWLPDICRKYEINSICDAGAGDLHWVKHIDWDVDYKPYDLIPRLPCVEYIDITTDDMASSDAILCRMVLNHLYDNEGGDDRVRMALNRFRGTANYLFATSFHGDSPQRSRYFVRLDLRDYLGLPLEQSRDGHEDNCYLAMWSLNAV